MCFLLAPIACGSLASRRRSSAGAIRSVRQSAVSTIRGQQDSVCVFACFVYFPLRVCFPLRYIQCADLKHAGNLFGSHMLEVSALSEIGQS